jgi:hypothetical protein
MPLAFLPFLCLPIDAADAHPIATLLLAREHGIKDGLPLRFVPAEVKDAAYGNVLPAPFARLFAS